MKTAHWLTDVSLALVPRDVDHGACRLLAQRYLDTLPTFIRGALTVLLWGLWLVATVIRGRKRSRAEAAAHILGRALESSNAAFYRLALWFKTNACLVVLGPENERRALYQGQGLALPSTAPKPRHAPLPSAQPQQGDVADDADYIVVGSGPGGATVARALARDGFSVLLLEEGPSISTAWRADHTIDNLGCLFRDAATLTTLPPEQLPVLQGCVVGGSSVVNSAIVWRAPDDVLADWHQDASIKKALPETRWHAAYDTIERHLGVEPTGHTILGGNSLLMEKACEALSIEGRPMDRYTKDCEGLGRCLEGCPKGHKLSMNATFIPDALRHGARLYAECRVQKVLFDGRRASGVLAMLQGKKRRFVAHHGVIIAAGAIHSPLLLKASGIRNHWIGRRFQVHPGVSVAARFEHPVRVGNFGATQGYESIHFRRSGRFKLETLNLPDELLASRIPGSGPAFGQALETLPHTALWAAQIRARAHGRVLGAPTMPIVQYHLTPQDRITLAKGIRTLVDMFFVAGAVEVYPSIQNLPRVIREPGELQLPESGIPPKHVAMIASHLFGTATLGSTASTGVCDAFGGVHDTEGLYVADASLFPTNLGVNPQHSIMALAQHVSWGILEGRKRAAA